MAYSHGGVLAATLERAANEGLEVTLLPEWDDVDTLEDLERLASDLDQGLVGCQKTSAALSGLGLTENTRTG
jgi:hypothetical protein